MDVRRGTDRNMRRINLNRAPGDVTVTVAAPWQPARDVASWVRDRGAACGECEHQVVTAGFDERCLLRPEWGCMGKVRHRRDRACPLGKWLAISG